MSLFLPLIVGFVLLSVFNSFSVIFFLSSLLHSFTQLFSSSSFGLTVYSFMQCFSPTGMYDLCKNLFGM